MGVLKALIASRKVWIALVAILAFVLVKYFGTGEELAEEVAEKVVGLAMLVIGAIAAEDVATKLKNPVTELKK